TNLNPNSSNFSKIKAMFEGLTTKKPSEKAFEGLKSVTNTTEPKAQLPSPKAKSTEGEPPPAAPEKTGETKQKYKELKQQHKANLLSKSVTPRLQKPPVPPRTVAPQAAELQATPRLQKPPVPPRTRTKNKFLQDKLDEVALTGKLDCKGITDESLINSALLKIRKAHLPIRTLDLSECHLTHLPTLLLEKKFEHLTSLQLNDNPILTQLPHNMDELLPKLAHLDISRTGINPIDSAGIFRLLRRTDLFIIELDVAPVTADEYRDKMTSIFGQKERFLGKTVKLSKDGSIKVFSSKAESIRSKLIAQREGLLKSAPGVELIMPFSQSKGRFNIACPGDGICAGISTAISLSVLAGQRVEGFLKNLYMDSSEGQRKGKVNLPYVHGLNELQSRVESLIQIEQYLKERNMEYKRLDYFGNEDAAAENLKSTVAFLQNQVWATTENKALDIRLHYKYGNGHVISFVISDEKNDKQEKAVYFAEPNIGIFRIWLKENSNQLNDFFLKYADSEYRTPEKFIVSEIKKAAAAST
ncbi:hypothetical protein, partial [Candidatus Hamiltonella defensa]